MKKYKVYLFFLFFGFLITFLSGCTKEEKLGFGPVQTGFVKDSVYQAQTDGSLTVEIAGNIVSAKHLARIYSDNTPDPSTEIGVINNPGLSTLPIRRNDYWKVVQEGTTNLDTYLNISIAWTPLE